MTTQQPTPAPELTTLLQAGWDGVAPAILINGAAQLLFLYARGEPLASWPVSTGRAGFGNQEGSGKTPLGVHRICECIGDGAPSGAVFVSRTPTGELVTPSTTPERDCITTRILWLEGVEPGINRGPGIDSRERFIYIHGTQREELIGQPASAGCIRMRNADILALFPHVQPGTLVVITH